MTTLARAFSAAWSCGAPLPADAELEPVLAALCATARAAWSSVAPSDEELVRWVAERVERAEDVSPERGGDWAIVCACAAGSSAAIAAFEARYFGGIEPALRRLRLDAAALEEAKQRLREEIFVAEPGALPRIARYSGRGDVAGWLRVTAVRSALKMLRGKRDAPTDRDELYDRMPPADDDPALAYMKELYRPAFKTAFQEALDSLSSRQQNLLRQHLLDELTVDQLGALYKVHRSTAARWLVEARDLLMRRTRTGLMHRIRIGSDECDSIMRLVESQLDGTIRRRLAAAG